MVDSIEDIVKSSLTFDIPSVTGWNRIYCAVCGDGSKTKGPRGGWLFQDEICFYHCFNCGIDGNFDPNREYPYSKEMSKIFKSFNIQKDVLKKLVFSKKIKDTNKLKIIKKEQTIIKGIDIPDHFYKLSEADVDDIIAVKAREYLKIRQVDLDNYPFYLSTGITQSKDPKDISFTKFLRNRLIIPSMKNNVMVYWIARALDEESKIPYVNASIPKSNIIYGFDKLYVDIPYYLFVCEGFFDAYHLNGVAVLENHITKEQIDILEKSPRNKIIVPDRHGDSDRLIEQGSALGWGISLPAIGACKDVSETINRYGKLYTLDSVMKNIYINKPAKWLLNSYNLWTK